MILIVRDDALPVLQEDFAELSGEVNDKHELFSELASALALPDYFGRNWDAFEECLGDREEQTDLVIRNARALWERMPREMMVLSDIWLDQAPDAQLVFVW